MGAVDGDAVAVGLAVTAIVGVGIGDGVALAVLVGAALPDALGDGDAPFGGGVVAAAEAVGLAATTVGLAFGAGVNTALPPLHAVSVTASRTSETNAREIPDM